MTFHSRCRDQNRVRLRIPWVIELEGVGLTAVIGSLLLAALIVGSVLGRFTPFP